MLHVVSFLLILLTQFEISVILCDVCLDAGPPSPADHLREVFYRMGLNDKVTLSSVYYFLDCACGVYAYDAILSVGNSCIIWGTHSGEVQT